MLSRKNQESAPNFLPLEWQQKIETLLFEIYKAQCQKDSSGFQVHGITYPNEVFLSVSYVNLKSPTSTPYTLLISADLDDKPILLKRWIILSTLWGCYSIIFFNLMIEKSKPDGMKLTFKKLKYTTEQLVRISLLLLRPIKF